MNTEKNLEKQLNNLRDAHAKKIEAYNKALSSKDLTALNKADSELAVVESDYAQASALSVWKELEVKGDKFATMKKAIEKYSYEVLGHHDDKKDGVVVERKPVTKSRQIDLLKMCARLDLDTAWQYKVEKLNCLMTMRMAQELKLPVEPIINTYAMQEIAKAINLGETPTSNRQLGIALQSVLNDMMFEKDDKGENAYKVNSHDVAYLLALYTKKGRETLSVSTAKHDFLRRILMDICNRILTNSMYSLEYKTAKDASKTEKVIEPPVKTKEVKQSTVASKKVA